MLNAANKNRKLLSLCALFLGVIVYLLYNVRRVIVGDQGFVAVFCVFSAILSVAVGVSFWAIFKKQIDFIKVLTVWVIGLLFVYFFIFPPATVPDERAHYLSAYRISNYFLFDFSQVTNPSLIIRECDMDYANNLSLNVSPDYIKSFYSDVSVFADNTAKIEWLTEDSSGNAPFGYVFAAFGIAVARLLRLSPFCTFMLPRLMNVLAFCIMLRFAVRKIPVGKLAILSITLLPIVLHLAASLSYDAITIAYAFCFMAEVMHIKNGKTKADKKNIIALLCFAMLLAPSKLVYLPLIFIMLTIESNRFSDNAKKAKIIKYSCILGTLLFFLALQIPTFLSTVADTQTGIGTVPSYTIGFIIENPFATLKIFRDTILKFGASYFVQMFSKTLGWLNVDVPIILCGAFMITTVTSFLKRENETLKVEFCEKIWILVCIIGSVGLIMLSMFIAVTPSDSPVIHGVQGRYFIPLMLPFYFIFRNKFITVRPSLDKYIAAALIALSAIAASELFTIVVSPAIL